jgi:antitoxin ParD1/3/4
MPSTTMNVSLPEQMKNFVEERLESGGYGSVSEYVRELIREDQKRREEEKLEKLLLSRLESKESDFSIQEVRKELAQRVKKGKNR